MGGIRGGGGTGRGAQGGVGHATRSTHAASLGLFLYARVKLPVKAAYTSERRLSCSCFCTPATWARLLRSRGGKGGRGGARCSATSGGRTVTFILSPGVASVMTGMVTVMAGCLLWLRAWEKGGGKLN